MTFFDLNIPYTESNRLISTTTEKTTRLKLTIKAIELGYTGVAYNRTISGVMSERDRCSISLFPLSSMSISTSVKLHRSLLNVPLSTPFRQYTRLTVVVDSPAQGSALNSGNPVLKTYDIVAVRPLKQESFDQACKNYEVDIIAIDFSETRFRLKQPLIKAAIERGVYFEITYSGLIMDAQLRRQMISNAKLLVDWTRGKNIIFSSAAPSLTELRGPCDVANLACLLGFSMERAKASVSKTCRALLESSLRKKKFVKEAIRVELISSGEQSDAFEDWLKWDPISSGEGDLLLDDMAKSFADANKDRKTVKAIDFVSIMNELPSHGLHIKDIVSETNLNPVLLDQPSNCETPLASENTKVLDNMDIEEETKIGSDSNICLSSPKAEQNNIQLEHLEAIHEEKISDENGSANTCSDIPTAVVTNSFDNNLYSTLQFEDANNSVSWTPISTPSIQSNETEVLKGEHVQEKVEVAVTPVSSSLLLSGVSSNENVPVEHTSLVVEDISVEPSSTIATLRSHDELQDNILEDESMEVTLEVKDDSQKIDLCAHESSSDRVRRKQRSSHRSVSLPFKRLLKPSQFKKAGKLKSRRTTLSLSDLID
ncbi:protein GAMETOPHYTE DEFECTIVE 1 [Rutidosis leptorrhynchoides]|uniref:protein GAMETOPHYTE DEFECTIVE 1 n=1 Tax=Rutidosis leptorrhynchoides TaxID=125765 RepID=UPI003A9A23DF